MKKFKVHKASPAPNAAESVESWLLEADLLLSAAPNSVHSSGSSPSFMLFIVVLVLGKRSRVATCSFRLKQRETFRNGREHSLNKGHIQELDPDRSLDQGWDPKLLNQLTPVGRCPVDVMGGSM